MTEEQLADYIKKTWKMFQVRTKVKLTDLFPEPENRGLKHIWKYGHADVVASRNRKTITVIEPGGGHHFDEKQALNDRRKYKLCEINGVKCLHFVTGIEERLSKRKFRNLIRKFLF